MIRLRLPRLSQLAHDPTLALPAGCRPDIEACLASGTLLLEQAGIETARLDAECLLAAVLARPRWQLMLEPARRLSADEFGHVLRLFQRRERREPLAYILGTREFWSLAFSVSSDVLVPRPETETLVETALAIWQGRQTNEPPASGNGGQHAGPAIVDLCTGSGAVAVVLAKEIPTARVLATDVSWRALRVARANAERHGVGKRITFLRGDLWQPVDGQVPAASADLVVANPPYIPTSELPTLMPEVRWEPRVALDGGDDGLRVVREIIASSPDRMRADGVLLLEIGVGQAERVEALVAASGRLELVRVRRDLAGRPRVVVARRRGL